MRHLRSRQRSWSEIAGLIAVPLLVDLAATGSPAAADHCDTDALASLLLNDGDVPAGYTLERDLSGEMDEGWIRQMAPDEDVQWSPQVCGYTRFWVDPEAGAIQSSVLDLRSDEAAGSAFQSMAAALESQALAPFDVPNIANEVAGVLDSPPPPIGRRTVAMYRSSHYVLFVTVIAPKAEVATARRLATVQASRSSSGSEGEGPPFDPFQVFAAMAGTFLGTGGLYVLGIAALARWRDPLSRRRDPVKAAAALASPSGAVVDVTARSQQARTAAGIGFACQIIGLSFLLPGLVPAFWPHGVALALLGAVLVLQVPIRVRQRLRGISKPRQRMVTGRRSARVIAFYALASALFLIGAVIAVVSLLVVMRDLPLVIPQESGDHITIDATTLGVIDLGIAIVAIAGAVGASRRARRLAALNARALMERDERPILTAEPEPQLGGHPPPPVGAEALIVDLDGQITEVAIGEHPGRRVDLDLPPRVERRLRHLHGSTRRFDGMSQQRSAMKA